MKFIIDELILYASGAIIGWPVRPSVHGVPEIKRRHLSFLLKELIEGLRILKTRAVSNFGDALTGRSDTYILAPTRLKENPKKATF